MAPSSGRPDPHNRRADRWYLLPAGVERLNTARSAGSPVMTQMLSLLKPQEVAELRGYLERCVEGLESGALRDAAPAAERRRKRDAFDSMTARLARHLHPSSEVGRRHCLQ